MLDLSGLNPPQREAVVHGDGPLLVLAGAGSGKTRVLTYRVAYLLQRGYPARSICALSFTNRAAEEMKERLASLVGKRDAEELTTSTFHSLGLGILKSQQAALGFPRGFTIYDGADQLGAVREVLRTIRVDDRRFDPKAVLHRISRAKNASIGPEAYAASLRSPDEYDELTAIVYPKYQEALRAFAAVDFDDLIGETVRLLQREDNPWSTRYRYLLVDEYQDTNKVQMAMVRGLSRGHDNVTVVGDDDQSIYAWRGAEAANILAFDQQFPGAKVVKLEQNYRSTPNILAAANAVIKNNSVRHDKQLWCDRAAGDKVVVSVTPDADAEAKFVCDEIERLRLEERRKLTEIAVLYRSNVQSRTLEEALRGRRIPFVMHGGQQFYERKEIKDVIAYLKLALNPSDDISLRRVINYPARGIGATTVERAAQFAQAQRIPLYEALRRLPDGFSAAAQKAVGEFVHLMERTRAKVQSDGAGAARELVEQIGLIDDLRKASTTALAAQRRCDNVFDFLKSLTDRQQREPGAESLRSYLHFLSLNAKDDDDKDRAADEVTMTTLHGAKGLEWPVVFLVGFEEELLPHARTLYPQGPDVDGEADVSEERRLAYVGITRARERLYLTRALMRHKHGRDRARVPSRFLLEIPQELLTQRDLLAEAKAPVAKNELVGFFRGFLDK